MKKNGHLHKTHSASTSVKEDQESSSYFESSDLEDVNEIANTSVTEKEKKYFDNNDSDDDDNIISTQVVEKTSDSAYGKCDELLGAGTFKRVYRGYDFNAGREVAWSEITPGDQFEVDYEKILDEINILKKLNHPNIIKYKTGWYDKYNNKFIIITELVTGGTLKQNLKRIKYPKLKLIKKWLTEILSALSYLHSMKIIHRDIKCDNIFLDKTLGVVKIGDFGGSELLIKNYGKNYIGTEEFMAPEVHEGKYTVKADIYSLGLTIIEMITGEKPYKECEGVFNIYEHKSKGIYPESLSKIMNDNVVKFVKMCLRREKDRPSADELLRDPFLNDLDSEENEKPVTIKNSLREKNISKACSEFRLDKVVKINENNFKISDYFSVSPRGLPSVSNKVVNLVGGIAAKNFSNIAKSTASGINDGQKRFLSPKTSRSQVFNENLKKKKASSFKITIKEVETKNGSESAGNKFGKNCVKEVEIQFVVEKIEWKNTKLIKCPYNLEKDTVEGVVNELQKAIGLTDEEAKIAKGKLTESLSKYTMSPTFSQRTTITSVSSDMIKPKLDEFNSKFALLTNNIKELMESDDMKKLSELSKDKKYPSEIIKIIEEYKKKENVLKKFFYNTFSSK